MTHISWFFSRPTRLFRRSRRTALPLRLELLEDRVQPSASAVPTTGVRSIDGSGNNLTHTTWGTAGTDLIRLSPVAYADKISTPSLPQDKSAREISNLLNNQADPGDPTEDVNTIDQQSLSDFGYVFGQFIDHDLDLTPDGGASFDIPVAATDPIGPNALPFTRSAYDSATGKSTTNPRQQVTDVTSYLDLSQVYGSDAATADALRTHSGGQLKTGPGNMLPYYNLTYFTSAQLAAINAAVGGMADDGAAPSSSLFATGDTRGNENIELTALQTLFLRNHNRIAAQLQAAHSAWTDEQVYQEARKINIAEYQTIVYNEWIPAVLGPTAIRPYSGYKANVNPSIASEFSTVAFRFGHSLLDNEIERQTNAGEDISIAGGADIPLAFDFFNPTLLNPAGVKDPFTGLTSTDIDPILKADADGVSQAMDLKAVEAVRNLLFGNGGAGGEDLMARDVQRGRDNGLPDYNTMRAAYGLPRITSFAQITSDVKVQQELKDAYGSVNNIDAFEGGLAEDHVRGSDVGPLFQAIMVDQFSRLRDGDRFFYLNEQMTPEESKIIQQGNSFSKIIMANTGITNLQSDVFHFHASIGGTVFNDANHNGRQDRGEMGLANVPVQLFDDEGALVATTKTDRNGAYQFTEYDGIGTGQYHIQTLLPKGYTQTTPVPSVLAVTRGDTNLHVNFGDYRPASHDTVVVMPMTPPQPGGGMPDGPTQPPANPPPKDAAPPPLRGKTGDSDADPKPVSPDATSADADFVPHGTDTGLVGFAQPPGLARG
jgi:peroxidase